MAAPEITSEQTTIESVSAECRARILERIPQQAPFRFVDTLDELSATHARGSYQFRADEFFYAGHFPGMPVTPGVILIECMAQIALVPLALLLSEAQAPVAAPTGSGTIPLFAEADEVEFSAPVRPGGRVFVRGERVYFRRGKLKCRVAMNFEDGTPVANAVLAGVAVSVIV
ncbi:MAG: hypothetical protein RIF32_05365 [Leptospirales bacterium]|jgi:3-hydroxyacyl-[acyl-carrier-protein] dehydratase